MFAWTIQVHVSTNTKKQNQQILSNTRHDMAKLSHIKAPVSIIYKLEVVLTPSIQVHYFGDHLYMFVSTSTWTF